jgi:ATP-binding cassette subfamily B protein
MGLTQAAEKIGMVAKGVKGPQEALGHAPLPCIAHVMAENRTQHYIVLASCGMKKIRYMDPAYGEMRSVSRTEFCRIWTGILLILAPAAVFRKGNGKTSAMKRYIQLVRPFRKVFIQSLTGALVYSLLGLSTAIYVQKVMDFVLVGHNLNLLNLMSLVMVLLLVLRSIIGYLKNLFLLKTGHQIDSGLIMGYYRHLLNLPQVFFDSMKTGEILSRMSDAVKIRHFINHTTIDLAVSTASIILTLLAMCILSWKLCLMVSAAIPLYAVILFLYDRFNRIILRKTMENAAELEARMVESISSNRSVRELGLQGYCMGRTEQSFIGFLRSNYRAGRASIRTSQATEFVSGLLTLILLWVGSVRVCNQFLSPGELMSFYAMLGYLAAPIASLSGSGRSIRDAGIAAERLYQILDLQRERNSDTGIRIKEFRTALEFRNVDFSYGSGPLLFNDLNFTLRSGSYTGIAGKNGCGKSSLVSLMMAMYHPRKGKILLDSYDTGQINIRDLRRIISVVPQQPELFSGTLLENIAPDEDEPDMRKILNLCEATGLGLLLDKTPDGICMSVGERGYSLSGGERQKMAIVRALYRDPPILILDEGTTALDPLSEENIFALLDNKRRNGMTLILISHKLRNMVRADQILFVDHGCVAEQGSHSELVKRKGEYFKYWNHQNDRPS